MTELTAQNIKGASFGKKFKKLLENIFFLDIFSKNYRRLIEELRNSIGFYTVRKRKFLIAKKMV